MKKAAALLLAATVACLSAGCARQEEPPAVPHEKLVTPYFIREEAASDNTAQTRQLPSQPLAAPPVSLDPGQTVELWLEDLIAWDYMEIADILNGAVSEDLLETASGAVRPLLDKTDYQIGTWKITENRAEVDLLLTVPLLDEVAGKIALQAISQSVVRQVMGWEPDASILLRQIEDTLLEEDLLTVTSPATLHLIQGADSQWRLDLSATENLAFVETLSGGLLEPALLETFLSLGIN